jgi:hypothetical protein
VEEVAVMRRTASALRWAGFALPAALALLSLYALVFPGEPLIRTPWETVQVVLLWVTPLAVLSAVALRWPSVAAPVLVAGVVLFVGTGVWYVLDPGGWTAWEGPDALRAAFALILLLPIALLGLERTALAGVLLLLLGTVLPVSMMVAGVTVAELLNRPEAGVSIVAVLAAVLYGLSHLADRHADRHADRTAGAPRRGDVLKPV